MKKAVNIASDIELFSEIKKGNTEAYELLFNRYWYALFQFSLKLLYSEDDAKDIVQSVFLYIWDKREKIQIRESVQGYLFQAVRHRSLDYLKELLNTAHPLETIPESLLPVFNDILQSIDYNELQHIIEKGMTGLPGRTREIFELSRHDELSIREISKKLNISEQTVKNQLSYALKLLRQSIALELLMIWVNFL